MDPGPPPLPTGAADIVRFFMDVPQVVQIGGVVLGAVAAVALAALLWRRRSDLLAYLQALPTSVKVTTIALLTVVGGAASVGGYRVYDYVEHDNSFCTGCHVMADAFVRFEESAHNQLGCKDCHAQPKTESARQLFLWVVDRPMEVGPHSPVPDIRCASCHVGQDEGQWPQIAASLGHRVHFDSDDSQVAGLMCVACHGVTVHEFIPVSATCGECHEAESAIRLGRMAGETELHCVACHDFLGREAVALPGAPEGMAMLPEGSQCLACHSMSAVLQEQELVGDPHGAVCGACHNPHTQDSPSAAVETCAGCHEGVESITQFHTGTHAPVLSNCVACHSAHSWQVDGNDCASCHGTIPDVRSQASAPRDQTPTAQATGWTGLSWAALAVHGGGGGGGAVAAAVLDAFSAPHSQGVSSLPGGELPRTGTGAQEPRPFTHERHQSVSCIQCHGRAGEHGVLTVRTPRDCAACHHDAARGYSCESCHGPAQVPVTRGVEARMDLTVWDAPRFRELEFRHDRHEGLTCQECHTGGVFLGVERGCADCHSDHHRPEATCTSCHVPAPEGVHGLETHLTCSSSGCHGGTSGERPPLSRTLCLTCHVEQQDHEPGLSCHSCHMIPEARE